MKMFYHLKLGQTRENNWRLVIELKVPDDVTAH